MSANFQLNVYFNRKCAMQFSSWLSSQISSSATMSSRSSSLSLSPIKMDFHMHFFYFSSFWQTHKEMQMQIEIKTRQRQTKPKKIIFSIQLSYRIVILLKPFPYGSYRWHENRKQMEMVHPSVNAVFALFHSVLMNRDNSNYWTSRGRNRKTKKLWPNAIRLNAFQRRRPRRVKNRRFYFDDCTMSEYEAGSERNRKIAYSMKYFYAKADTKNRSRRKTKANAKNMLFGSGTHDLFHVDKNKSFRMNF